MCPIGLAAHLRSIPQANTCLHATSATSAKASVASFSARTRRKFFPLFFLIISTVKKWFSSAEVLPSNSRYRRRDSRLPPW